MSRFTNEEECTRKTGNHSSGIVPPANGFL
jgi:hypothetical protein